MFADRHLTYQELNAQADQVASGRIEAGVRPGHIVALWLPRGVGLLVMQSGIAKAGAAWLPFDSDTPVERIAVGMEDACAAGVVSCEEFASRLAHINVSVWTAQALLVSTPERIRRQDLLPSHSVYVIYTFDANAGSIEELLAPAGMSVREVQG